MAKQPATAPTAEAPVDDTPASRQRETRYKEAICPKNDYHEAKVYKTEGRKRYCKCNSCGETWKQTGDFADPLRNVCADLVYTLEASKAVQVEAGGEKVILFAQTDAERLIAQLRKLLPL